MTILNFLAKNMEVNTPEKIKEALERESDSTILEILDSKELTQIEIMKSALIYIISNDSLYTPRLDTKKNWRDIN